MIIRTIIPVFNEEKSIGKVIKALPSSLIKEIIVVDNGSTDQTSTIAQNAGATVLYQPQKGYGAACLKGIQYVNENKLETDIVVFIDGDFSDFPEELPKVIEPIIKQNFDLVIGSRVLGNSERGSLTPQQRFGNWLATKLLYLFFEAQFTDLGPFRAIKYEKLKLLNMQDTNFGWTVEMQIKAAGDKLTFTEVPVSYRKRIGKSKISGTVKGTILAGRKILWLLFKYALWK